MQIRFVLVVLATLVGGTGVSAAQEALTADRAEALVSSLEELIPAMAGDDGNRQLRSGKPGDVQQWLQNLQTSSAFNAVIAKYGFDRTDWSRTLGKVMEGYMALQLQGNSAKMEAEVAQARKRIMSDTSMAEGTKRVVLDQLEQSMAKVRAMVAGGAANSGAVAPYVDRLSAVLKPK